MFAGDLWFCCGVWHWIIWVLWDERWWSLSKGLVPGHAEGGALDWDQRFSLLVSEAVCELSSFWRKQLSGSAGDVCLSNIHEC